MSFHDQSQYNLRFEWGREGLEALASTVDVIVIVDVLSFTTTVEIGVTQGATLYPYRMRDNTAADYAREKDAVLAVARGQEDDKHPYSLSPQSMTKAKSGARIVLPSPNGATLSTVAARYDATVLAGCLRNASAVAGACRSCGERIAVIAAGERWQGDRGDLRPAIEDLIGAGAILNAIDEKSVSPEAAVAIAAYLAVADDLPTTLRECSSGRELTQVGFAADIKLAAAVDVSTTVPILRDAAFVKLWPSR